MLWTASLPCSGLFASAALSFSAPSRSSAAPPPENGVLELPTTTSAVVTLTPRLVRSRFDVVFKFQEGCTTAVRRPVFIGEFL